MNRVRTLATTGAVTVAAVAAFLLSAPPAVAAGTSTKTLANLQSAYNGESNAHAKYLASAKKADEEGFGAAASLFRAAAKAEAIHAENHARVILQAGRESPLKSRRHREHERRA
jgi:rubrerythrin